jgi:hypothetical protein
MADGTFKTALDLQVGDYVKTITIPDTNIIQSPVYSEITNYNITLSQLQSTATYSTNKVTNKEKVNVYQNIVKIKFTDGTDWFDTPNSYYLCIKNNEVRFLSLKDIIPDEYKVLPGDKIILIDTANSETPVFVEKIVDTIETIKEFFSGWILTVETNHLFLTKTSSETNTSFVAIEHNYLYCGAPYWAGCNQDVQCAKGWYCCSTTNECRPNCSTCPIP